MSEVPQAACLVLLDNPRKLFGGLHVVGADGRAIRERIEEVPGIVDDKRNQAFLLALAEGQTSQRQAGNHRGPSRVRVVDFAAPAREPPLLLLVDEFMDVRVVLAAQEDTARRGTDNVTDVAAVYRHLGLVQGDRFGAGRGRGG